MRKLFFVLLVIILFTASCASSTHVRKCNGERGVVVPMGVL